MSAKQVYKNCIVPCCKNSTANSSEKLFFGIPKDPVKRKVWTRAMKRDEKQNKDCLPLQRFGAVRIIFQ